MYRSNLYTTLIKAQYGPEWGSVKVGTFKISNEVALALSRHVVPPSFGRPSPDLQSPEIKQQAPEIRP